MDELQILDWDSAFFGFRVGRIIVPALDRQRLKQVLAEARRQKVTLVYWNIGADEVSSREAAEVLNGSLVEDKLRYVVRLDPQVVPSASAGFAVEEYAGTEPTPAMEKLALESGVYSRFRLDEKISSLQFEGLYYAWVRESTARRFAEVVLVGRMQDGRIAGQLTLGRKNDRGDIGLLAVDSGARCRGLGRALVTAAHGWCLRNGLSACQVETQQNNIPARKLYEKCNYTVDAIEKVFHFWL